MVEDRKDESHQSPPQAGKTRRSSPLETPASASLQMPRASDSASLLGYVSWLELQNQQAVRHLTTVDAANTPAVQSHYTNVPRHISSRYPLGLEFLQHGIDTNQVYRSAPAAYGNSLPINEAADAAGACQKWNGMPSFPLGSSAECTGEMEGFVAGLEGNDTSWSSDRSAMLMQQSFLQASACGLSGFSGGEAIWDSC